MGIAEVPQANLPAMVLAMEEIFSIYDTQLMLSIEFTWTMGDFAAL